MRQRENSVILYYLFNDDIFIPETINEKEIMSISYLANIVSDYINCGMVLRTITKSPCKQGGYFVTFTFSKDKK